MFKPTVNKVATSAGQILHIGFVCLNLKKTLTLNIYVYVFMCIMCIFFAWILRVTTELLKIVTEYWSRDFFPLRKVHVLTLNVIEVEEL